MPNLPARFAEKRRILQLETLYDLALALHAHRPEQELVDELLQRVVPVLDPAAAVAVTRDPYGGARASATVGWAGSPPSGEALLADPLWRELLTEGRLLARRGGRFAGRAFDELIATPLAYRGVFLGFIVLIDKESRGGAEPSFSDDDRRFLDSVASLAGVALDAQRNVERLETQRERLAEENKALRGRLVGEVAGQRIVAQAPEMRQVLEVVERVAPRGVSVLVRGESGTGKELIAKLLHLLSGREGPLVALNCAALPESLLESELFGIEGGVATGVQARSGKFELADGGTLFLDEIGDISPKLQVDLLRVLQERRFFRVGGSTEIAVDVRVIAATHRDLAAAVREGTFRDDLYYRLNVINIRIPPLRERREDIPLLAQEFVDRLSPELSKEVTDISEEALRLLMDHDWPGNVRQLENAVERAIVTCKTRTLTAEDFAFLRPPATERRSELGLPAGLTLQEIEKEYIAATLRRTEGNVKEAAASLGIDRSGRMRCR
jgi:transcriptional regulator with GAF, ATPase, and Fis domain